MYFHRKRWNKDCCCVVHSFTREIGRFGMISVFHGFLSLLLPDYFLRYGSLALSHRTMVDLSFPLPSSMWKFEGFGGFCNVEWVGILGPRFCRASNMWLVRTLFAPLASFCRWLFPKNIFGLMSSTVGIAVSVIVPSVWRRGVVLRDLKDFILAVILTLEWKEGKFCDNYRWPRHCPIFGNKIVKYWKKYDK